MARPLWKGAISFGLVTIPVNVYSATRTDDAALPPARPARQLAHPREARQRGDRRRGRVGRRRQGLRVRGRLVRRPRPGRLHQGQRQGHRDHRHRPGGAAGRDPGRVLREAALRGAVQGRASRPTTSCVRRCGAAGRVGRGDHRHARPPAPGGADRRRADHHARAAALRARDQGRGASSGADEFLDGARGQGQGGRARRAAGGGARRAVGAGAVPRRVPRRPPAS